MKATYSDILMDTITIFRVDGDIPNGVNAIRIDGAVHDLIPSYGGQDVTLAIHGAYNLSGKKVDFLKAKKSGLVVMLALFLLLLLVIPGFNAYAENTVQVSYEPFEPFATPEPDYQPLDPEDITYSILEDGTVSIDEYSGKLEYAMIPEELYGKKVTQIGKQAFDKSNTIVQVIIPEGIVSIKEMAFYRCDVLESVTIPDSLTHVEGNPFVDCPELKDIQLSPDNKYLEIINGVLYSKPDKRLIRYPEKSSEQHYRVPQEVLEIAGSAFRGCDRLVSVRMPDSVTVIGKFAFSYCTNLNAVYLKEGLTEIGDSAFTGCTSLKEITLPESITQMGANPFVNCSALTTINVSPDHLYLATIDGVLFSKPDKRLICYPYTMELTAYTIPSGVREIGDNAFAHNTSLREVVITDRVESIGAWAFGYCDPLTDITIPESVTNIGKEAFYRCENLTAMVIRGSYGAAYCKGKKIKYTYPDANDWLND